MTIEKLLVGLRENYPASLHPGEIGERDLGRSIMRAGVSGGDVEKLYVMLLESCEYYPRVKDIHDCVKRIKAERVGISQLEQTRKMLKEREEKEKSGGPVMTLKEFLWENGGYELMLEDHEGDEEKLGRTLRVMGVMEIPEGKMGGHRGEGVMVMGREPGCDDDAGEYESLGDL